MMKGKLVKEYEDFYLISDKEIEKGDEYVKLNNRPRTLLLGTTISHVTKVSKLSLKNCEAIELGYDLDELAKEYWVDEYYNSHGSVLEMNDFKEGFNKAMELNKDKLFTLEQVLDAFYAGWISKDKTYPEAQKSYKGYLERHVMQPTEIEVEVVMDRIPADLAPGGWDVFPKLDSQGCLILKKVL